MITDELLAKNVKTETLCVGATCITEAELLQLLGKSQVDAVETQINADNNTSQINADNATTTQAQIDADTQTQIDADTASSTIAAE